MAKRDIFALNNLPESLTTASENKLMSVKPLVWFYGVLVAMVASLLESFRAAVKPPIKSTTALVDAPAINTAAVVTFAAAAGVTHCITGFAYSYEGTTTTGNLKVRDGTDIVFNQDVPAGSGTIVFPVPIKGTAGNLLSVTAAAGGAASTGKVSVLNHFTL